MARILVADGLEERVPYRSVPGRQIAAAVAAAGVRDIALAVRAQRRVGRGRGRGPVAAELVPLILTRKCASARAGVRTKLIGLRKRSYGHAPPDVAEGRQPRHSVLDVELVKCCVVMGGVCTTKTSHRLWIWRPIGEEDEFGLDP